MAEIKNQIAKKENNQQEMETMHYRPNEANINYNGITLNVDIPQFLKNIKKFNEKRRERKREKQAFKELKKLEGKTLRDVKHYEEVIDYDEE